MDRKNAPSAVLEEEAYSHGYDDGFLHGIDYIMKEINGLVDKAQNDFDKVRMPYEHS